MCLLVSLFTTELPELLLCCIVTVIYESRGHGHLTLQTKSLPPPSHQSLTGQLPRRCQLPENTLVVLSLAHQPQLPILEPPRSPPPDLLSRLVLHHTVLALDAAYIFAGDWISI